MPLWLLHSSKLIRSRGDLGLGRMKSNGKKIGLGPGMARSEL